MGRLLPQGTSTKRGLSYSTGMVCNLTRRGGSKYSVLQFFLSEQGGVYIRTGNWNLESEEKYNTWEKFYPKE